MVMDNEVDFCNSIWSEQWLWIILFGFPFDIFGLGAHLQKLLYRQLLRNHHLPIIPYVRELDLSEMNMSVLSQGTKKVSCIGKDST